MMNNNKGDRARNCNIRADRELIRALLPETMQVERRLHLIGHTGCTLAQVLVRDPKQDGVPVCLVSCAVDPDPDVADRRAIQALIPKVLQLHTERLMAAGLPIDPESISHMTKRFGRQLAVDGGPWVEESSRGRSTSGQSRCSRSRIFHSAIDAVGAPDDALSLLAQSYT
jgi:hypothetical protein